MLGVAIEKAVWALAQGHVTAFPTETVYGLGADAQNEEAIQRVFQMKGRPSFNPLIVHVASVADAKKIGVFNADAEKVANAFWPGPLSLVLPLQEHHKLAPSVTAGLKTVALRCPLHETALQLLREYKKPLAAPSANKSGTLTLLRSADVWEAFKEFEDFHIIDGDIPNIGLESTILDLSSDEPLILRPGFVTKKALEDFLGRTVMTHMPHKKDEIRSPGMMLRHYAPKKPLFLDVSSPLSNQLYLGFGDMDCHLNLSVSKNLFEAAQNLYIMLKDLDETFEGDYDSIAVAPLPKDGIGFAMYDRLKRASGFYNKGGKL